MKNLTIIVRSLLGLTFVVFGLNAFLQFIPLPPPQGLAGDFTKSAFMKSPARPCGGGRGMNCRNAFRPNTTKVSPSRLRTMMVRFFMLFLFLVQFGYFQVH